MTAKEVIMEGNEGYPFRYVIDNLTEEDILDCMKEFAKMHVEQALKEAINNTKDSYVTEEDEEDILNCYPLTNIE
jgi:hypothetical protein